MNLPPSRQSLRSKLTIYLSLLFLVISSIIALGVYRELVNSQVNAAQDRLGDMLRFAAPLIDGDFHALIRSPQDKNSPVYSLILNRLKTIQQSSTAISHIYTLRLQPDGSFVYVVDAGAPPAEVGQPYLLKSAVLSQDAANIYAPLIDSDPLRLSGVIF